MIAGGIDLSVGSTVALVTVCIALFVKKVDPSLPDSLREMKLVCAGRTPAGNRDRRVMRRDQRRLDRRLRVVPFIVTLGTYTIYRGLAKWLASSTTVYVPGDAKPWWFSRILKIDPNRAGFCSRPASGPCWC